jgi:hypothetical protein
MDGAFDKYYEVALEQQKMHKAKLADIEKSYEEMEDDFYLYKKVPEGFPTFYFLIKKGANVSQLLTWWVTNNLLLQSPFLENRYSARI